MEPQVGVRYYSLACGTRYWWYTGRNWQPQDYPYYGEGTVVYEFEDIADCRATYTLEQFEKYFEER